MQRTQRRGVSGGQIVAMVVTAVFGIPLLLVLYTVIGAQFGGPSSDPHGYVLIFGSLLAIPLALVTCAIAPLMFPVRWYGRTYAISGLVFVLIFVGLAVPFLTG